VGAGRQFEAQSCNVLPSRHYADKPRLGMKEASPWYPAASMLMKFSQFSLSLTALMAVTSLPLACSSEDAPGNSPTAGGGAGQSSAGSGAQSGGAGSSVGGSSVGTAGVGTSGAPGGGSGSAGTPNGGGAGVSTGGGNAGGGGGTGAATPSAGCTMPAGMELGKWVEQPKLNVNGTDRQWWLWLPTGYDPTKAYPVIFNFHGCGGNDNIVPMPKVAGDKAILVRGAGINDGCWDQGPDGIDVKFFDQMLAEVAAKRCADTSRVFATGYSSGSWLVNSLECVRGDKLRATGTVAGGVQFGDDTPCVGKVARIFVHDHDDPENPIAWGNDGERARMVEQNHCMAATTPEDPAPCVRHDGCDPGYPVIWCETMGKGHNRQDDLAPGAFWKLFSSL
jgi:polyhydroxybutyrate depolymerase